MNLDFLGLPIAVAEDFNLYAFFFNLLLTIIFSSSLGFLFQKYSLSFSDRRRMASTFMLLAVGIMCVISVVKVSLALSLGLVGALSIVRFRTAIKEPEELVFLFLTIVIGIAHGANQSVIGAAVFVVSAVLTVVRYYAFSKFQVSSRYSHIILTGTGESAEIMDNVETILKSRGIRSELQRLDSTEGHTELVLDILFLNPEALRDTIEAFTAQSSSVTYILGGNE